MLQVRSLEASYGLSRVLFGVNLDVREGEVVTLLGRNGMGKTTTVRSIMGMMASTAGSVNFDGEPLRGMPSYRVARRGIGLVPEGRQVFPNLTVRENLIATARATNGSRRSWALDDVLSLFPNLASRLSNIGRELSGGEQQMLAIGRALLMNPRLLVLDEATEGLAPLARQQIWACIGQLKAHGQSILLIDKNLASLMALADRHYIIEKGKIIWAGTSADLSDDRGRLSVYLGL
jgi:branched-chain amino acid transport system ATP-binding protein